MHPSFLDPAVLELQDLGTSVYVIATSPVLRKHKWSTESANTHFQNSGRKSNWQTQQGAETGTVHDHIMKVSHVENAFF